ncbi:hypothetical protein B0H16DRAFT_1463029 [Mycena metata]|uniref:Uncharacterized protein n=1 Tax=Mycena metata TaxID=1033252 RepID=A0AAD7IK13_9AGAR|nr:hypothetical protein B0H16DRAFT_1463029 [Mycena metata]
MVEKDLIVCTDNFSAETLGKAWKAVYGRRRPPVPVPFMRSARGMTGRDGTPLTGPVPPVKTVTASIPSKFVVDGDIRSRRELGRLVLNLRRHRVQRLFGALPTPIQYFLVLMMGPREREFILVEFGRFQLKYIVVAIRLVRKFKTVSVALRGFEVKKM